MILTKNEYWPRKNKTTKLRRQLFYIIHFVLSVAIYSIWRLIDLTRVYEGSFISFHTSFSTVSQLISWICRLTGLSVIGQLHVTENKIKLVVLRDRRLLNRIKVSILPTSVFFNLSWMLLFNISLCLCFCRLWKTRKVWTVTF